MNLKRLVIREILLHRISFGLVLASVVVAAGVFVAQMTMLEIHEIQTERILAEKQAKITEEMRILEDDYRKIMKELGFNLLILPEGQQLQNFYSDGYASEFMPEEYVTALSKSGIMTVQHLLPSIEQRVRWQEQGNRTVNLVGTRGEVPIVNIDPKEPMLIAVPPGKIVLGYELWSSLDLTAGDTVKLLDNDFIVHECYPQRGNKDDITAWIDLGKAQELFGRKGQINAIMALKCMCAGEDLDLVRSDLEQILPNTQVIEFENIVLTRYKARVRAQAAADSSLAAETRYRAELHRERQNHASLIIPMVIIASSSLVCFLMFTNVRERRQEIGILRALGFRARQILGMFLAKALIVGFLGAIVGYMAGITFSIIAGGFSANVLTNEIVLKPNLLVLVLIATPLMTSVASWLPALTATRQDPADIIREE